MTIVEYALKMNDYATGTLGRIASQMKSVKAEAEQLANQADNTAKALDFGKMLKGAIGVGAVIAAARKVGSYFHDAVQDQFDRQQLQISFNVLTGSKEVGEQLTKDLVALQKDTVLGPEVFKNAQTMMSFGFDASEVLPNMRMLGDVSIGDADKLNSLTLAFSQVRAAGRLTGQDLLQFVNAGFNPLNELVKTTGKSMGELRDEMSKGNITFDMVRQAFANATSEGGTFNNMLGTIAQSDAGISQKIAGSWQEIKIKFGEALQPLTRLWLTFQTKMLPVVESATVVVHGLAVSVAHAAQFMSDFAPLLLGVAGAITAVTIAVKAHSIALKVATVATKIMAGAQAVLNAIMTANPIGLIIAGVAVLVGWIATLIRKFDEWGAIVSLVMFPIINVIVSLKRNWQSVVDAFRGEGIIAGLKRIGQVLLDVVLYPVQRLLEAVGNIIPAAAKGAAKLADLRKSMNLYTPEKGLAEKEESKQTNDKLAEIAANTAANNETVKSNNEAIASAGPKQVTINVQKFFDNIQFSTTNLTESTDKLEQTVLEVLSRVLVQGAAQSV